MYKYSAYVRTTSARDGTMQHVIANAQTEKGLLSVLKRYTVTNGHNVQYAPSTIVYMWHIDAGVYSKRLFSSFS